MTNELELILNDKLRDPSAKKDIDTLITNLENVTNLVQWIAELQEKGMTDSLKGIVYATASLRSILTDDMLNGVSTMLNSLLEVLAKLSDPAVMQELLTVLDGISSGKFAEEPKIHGTFSLLGELKDPDVSRGLSVAINLIKHLGKMGKTS